jgi:alpha-L-fucosidase 2
LAVTGKRGLYRRAGMAVDRSLRRRWGGGRGLPLVLAAVIAVALSSSRAVRAEAGCGDLCLWYTAPAQSWRDGLPVGNGRLGAMVAGGAARDRITVNVDDLWDGGPGRYQPATAAREALPALRRALFAGEARLAAELAVDTQLASPRYPDRYQPLGYLDLVHMGLGEVTGYRRQLNLESGVASVSFTSRGVAYRRDVFVSAADDVIVIHLSASQPASLDLDIQLDRRREATITVPEEGPAYAFIRGRAGSEPQAGWAAMLDGWLGRQPPAGEAELPGPRFAAGVLLHNTGGQVGRKQQRLLLREADSATLLVAGATEQQDFETLNHVRDRLAGLAGRSYQELRAAHLAAYQPRFGRVALDLDPDPGPGSLPTDRRLQRLAEGNVDRGLLSLYFQYGRYLLMSSASPGSLPPNRQGLWNDSMLPPWGSAYALDGGLQMNHWGTWQVNLGESAVPLVDWVDILAQQ